MLASAIYGATGIATGVQLWWLMSWAIWGVPLNPLEYVGLLGSAVLLTAAVLGLRKRRNAKFLASGGLLLLWPFYAILIYATWLTPSVSFTFRAATIGSVPAAMLLGSTVYAGMKVSASWRAHRSPKA